MADEHAIDVARNNERINTLFSQVKEMKQDIKEVQQLVSSVDKLANSVATMATGMSKLEKKVDNLTMKPVEKWEKLMWYVGMLVVGAIVGIALSHVGLTP